MKVKIINSESLKNLRTTLLRSIDDANIQAHIYSEEIQKQKSSKGEKAIIEPTEQVMQDWLDRSQILHECLADIDRFTTEIEI